MKFNFIRVLFYLIRSKIASYGIIKSLIKYDNFSKSDAMKFVEKCWKKILKMTKRGDPINKIIDSGTMYLINKPKRIKIKSYPIRIKIVFDLYHTYSEN